MNTKERESGDGRSLREILPLTPAVFHILLALADGEKHGYAIMQEVEKRTGGEMKMGPGTLYGSIQRMLRDGLIVELPERATRDLGEERRRYYGLSGFGQRILRAEAIRLADLVEQVRQKQVLPGLNLEGGLA